MHFQGSLSHGFTTVSNVLENFAGWLSELLSFFPFNDSQYANMCLSESRALTFHPQALSLFLQNNWLLLGS